MSRNNGNQGMHCLGECAMPGCRVNGLGRNGCGFDVGADPTYCQDHGGSAGFKAGADAPRFTLPGWYLGQPVALGTFEGMPVKKALALRKLARKPVKATRFKASTVPCPHCQGTGRVSGHVALLAAVA